jgi:hypothetical protein
MTMKRILSITLAAAFLGCVFSGCVRDEELIFEKSASLRLKDVVDNAQKTLVGAEYGWKLYYYPHPDLDYGGYMFTLKFTEDKVEAWGDLFSKSSTSLYKMSYDDGPVLSFDTGNEVLHYFATPSGTSKNLYGESGLYQAHKGDFEFLIMKSSPEEIVLKGKRSGNILYMYPLSESPESYIAKATQTYNDVFVSSYTGTISGEPAEAYIDLTNRWITLKLTSDSHAEADDAEAEVPFLYTDTGLLFHDPVTIGGYTIEALDWVNDTQSLVSRSGDPVAVSLKGQLPPGWRSYDDLLGDYDLLFNDSGEPFWSAPRHANVSLIEDEYKKSMIMTGVNDNYTIKIGYDLSSGNLSMRGQIIGQYGANDVYWAPIFARANAAGTGMTYSGWRSTNYGMKLYVDDDASAEAGTIVIKFSPGPNPSAAQPITGFALIGQTPSGASAGYMTGNAYADWFPFGYRGYAVLWVTMTKK